MKPLFTGLEWDNKLLLDMWDVINDIAINKFGLSYYPDPTIEIVSYDQMIYYCTNHGLPQIYDHWSFGKNYIATRKEYEKGRHGLAYEVIINSNPLRAYLMDTNTATMQALVLAHAICGHGHFFTNNYLFKEWTIADYILDYMQYAHDYVKSVEEIYGAERVEKILTTCHILQPYGVDKYRRKPKTKASVIQDRYDDYRRSIEKNKSELWEGQETKSFSDFASGFDRTLPEENLLYFVEKNSKVLKPWEKELVRIVRKTAQYFYPQYQTKLMNEGFASFVHYKLMTELYTQEYLTDGAYVEFLHNHTNVCCAHDGALTNPYSLGVEIFNEIYEKSGWDGVKDAVVNYRDESFILQFCSSEIIKKFRMAVLVDNDKNHALYIGGVHESDDTDYVKTALAKSWSHSSYFLDLAITRAEDVDGRYEVDITHNSGKDRETMSRTTCRILEEAMGDLLGTTWVYTIQRDINYNNSRVR